MTWVESVNAAGSQTSSSLGAMLKSPHTASGGPSASAASAPRSAASQSSLYCRCGLSRARPFGTYTDQMRQPWQVAETARASGSGKPGSPGNPRRTSSSPVRDKMATPFHRPVPYTAAW